MRRTPVPTKKLALRAAALLAAAFALLAAPASDAQRGGKLVYRIPVTGDIEMGLAPFVARALDEAEAAGAAAAVLDIDTPGGRIDAAEAIADALQDAKVPTYAFVNRRAFSAGAMIALATDGIYMLPGSSLGAATPVYSDGSKGSEKLVSAMRSEFRALAEARGLNPAIAEAMVDEAVAVPGVDEAGKLLTLSTGEAVRVGYAREVASWEAVLAQVGAPGAAVVTARTNWAERLVRFFTNPLVAPFLLTLGFLGLVIELKTPSFGLAGLAGASSLGLFFGSHLLLGLAGWESILLLCAGIVLLLVELLVLPGFGVAGVLGITAVVGSILLAMLGAAPTTADVGIAMAVLSSSVIMVVFALWQLVRHLPDDRRGRRLLLTSALSRDRGYVAAPVRGDLEGRTGVALTDLRPSGTAEFGGERVDVVSDGSYVPSGTPVRVVRSEGYRHVVVPVAAAALDRTLPGV